jgi:hypothetical protein
VDGHAAQGSNARSSCCVSAAAVFVDHQGSSLSLGAVRWLFRPAHSGRERDGLLSCFRDQGLAPVCLVCLVSASDCLGRARVGHRPPGSAELGRLVLPRLCFACAPRAPVTTYSSSTGPGARREHGSRGAAHGSHERGYVRTVAAVCMLFSDAHSDYLDQASTRYKHSPAELHMIVNN